MSTPRVAIAHDYLTQRGGAERVVLALARAFPDAPIFTTLYQPDATYPEFRELRITASWLNRVSLFRNRHRLALPLLPLVSSGIRIDADIVIASSSGWAHGFRTEGRMLVYCHSPARWVYEGETYLGGTSRSVTGHALRLLGPSLRRWDQSAARRADVYLANSSITRDRIQLRYGREAAVVPPPHGMVASEATSAPVVGLPEPGFFLVVSRLLPYKNVAAIVRAFGLLPTHRLLVVGSGPEEQALKDLAGPNVSFREGLSDVEMRALYRSCAALVAASHEDFGLTPLEAAAHGKPSVVLRAGGFLDTVIEGATGVFFDQPEPAAIATAIATANAIAWDPRALERRAAEFSEERFAERIKGEVAELLAEAEGRRDGET